MYYLHNVKLKLKKNPEIMEKYNYYQSMFSAIKCWLEENGYTPERIISEDYDYDEIYDAMFISDSVTGNASGSYTFNLFVAEEYLCHNMDLLHQALLDFYGSDSSVFCDSLFDAEWCDVTIRCYLLASCLNAVIGSIENCEPLSDEL